MAKVWFTCNFGTPSLLTTFRQARFALAQQIAKERQYPCSKEKDGDDRHLAVEIPDHEVNDALSYFIAVGIAPGVIDFDDLTGVEAEEASTYIFDHETIELPED